MLAVRVLVPLIFLELTACSAQSLTQVRGEVRSWTFGTGTVEFLSDDLTTLSTADLDRVGRFTLQLPGAQTITPLLQDSLIADELPAGCSNTVKASSDARFYSLGDISAYPTSGEKNAYTLTSEDRGTGNPLKVTKRLFMYASKAVKVSGKLSCPVGNEQAVAVYGLDLRPGWNQVATSQTVYASGRSDTSISIAGDDGFNRWTLVPAPPR